MTSTGAAVVTSEKNGNHRSEAEQLQAGKMETLGYLTIGVVHDFNNLLNVIVGHCELLLRKLQAEDPLRSNAENIRHAAESAALMTSNLLAYSRQRTLRPCLLDANKAMADLMRLLPRMLGTHIDTRFIPDPVACPIRMDPGELHQIVMNLAINARDSMPGGGKLTIEVANLLCRPALVESLIPLRGNCVLISFTDTGSGIDENTQHSIFQPFYTTKTEGYGIGLPNALRIVERRGGQLSVRSELGRGTTFNVYLPLANPEEEAPLFA